jgi:hypothetical protein
MLVDLAKTTSTALSWIASLTLALTLSACSGAVGVVHRLFDSPEAAARALHDAAAKGSVDEVLAIFGPEGKELLDTSDPASARRNRAVFAVAFAEAWRLVDDGGRKWLIIGNEQWPFPVPLVKERGGWRFDTAAGKEEVLARRIGRNELAAIRVCRAYVAAQRRYASRGHDGKRAGLYASTFRSDPGRHNGLYWPAARGEPRSPLGELLSEAAVARRDTSAGGTPAPFYGYYFRILTAQGPAATGGAMDYVVDGAMSRGFALIAWPAQYDVTGIMTFLVSNEGLVHQRDLGRDTDATARNIARYDPDESWSATH